MTWGLTFDNVVAYSLQIGMLVGVAAVVPTVLRLRQPGAKLLYWQILLAACLLLPLQPWKQIVNTGSVQVTTMVTAVHQAAAHSSSGFTIPRSQIAMLLMLAGVAIRLTWLAVGFGKLSRYRRHSLPLEPAASWSVEADLRISEEVMSPVTFGWRKPVVLLPESFPTLDTQVQEAILCHEIMHVRRGDWLFTVAEELVRAIFWFHPAIWWLLGEIGLAREQQVDRLAIEITQEREQYMDALLAIAGARPQLDLAPAPLFLRRRHLKHRVVAILKESRVSTVRAVSTLVTGLAMVAAVCWLVTGAFPLVAQPQVVNDAAGISVNLEGSTVLHRTAVHYPATALQKGVQGPVSVEVKLDAAGNVSDARILSGPEELRSAVLQSVLDWHFTRDAANSVQAVQISFELPNSVAGGVIGGVVGGVRGGVTAGVIAGVPGGVLGATKAEPHIGSIAVNGLSDQARGELLAALPVHEGDTVSTDQMRQINQTVRAFDEHLTVSLQSRASRISPGEALETVVPATLVISAPSSGPPLAAMQALRQQAALSISDNNMGAPPPQSTTITMNAPERIKVGGDAVAAKIIRKVAPVYPELAKSARVQGVVHLAAVIGKDGTVQELHSLGGPALLIQAAMDAAKGWIFQPIYLNGAPVSVETTIDIDFSLSQ